MIEKIYLCSDIAGSSEWVDKSDIIDDEMKCVYDLDDFDPSECLHSEQGLPKEKCKVYKEYNLGRRDSTKPRRKEDNV